MDADDSGETGTLTPNTTKLWGHSHNDEMHGEDAFVSDKCHTAG